MAEQENPLSERELDVMRLVVTGATNQEVAHSLDISPNTVKVHLRNVYEKLEVASRTEATLVVIRNGWLNVPGIEIESAAAMDEEEGPALPEEEESAEDTVAEPAPTEDSVKGEASMVEEVDISASVLAGIPRWMAAAFGALTLSLVLVVVVLAWQLWRQPGGGSVDTETMSARRWMTVNDLSGPRAGAAAVTYQGRVYVIGGESPEGPRAPLERYHEGEDIWQTVAPKSFPVTDVQAAVLGGLIYVPGGVLANGDPIDAVEVYDPQADRWERAGDLPRPLARYALASYEGQLYVAGGWDGERVRDEVLTYDPETDSWSQVARLPEPRAGIAAAVANDSIYFIGGHDADETPSRTVWRFDPSETESNREGPALPTALPKPTAAVLGDTLYVLGGQKLWRLEQQEEHWLALEPPPDVLLPENGAFVARDPYLYVVGGISPQADASDPAMVSTVLRYQAIFRTFVPAAPGQ